VNEALRAMKGCKIHDMTQLVAALWREMNVAPVCAAAGGRRVRAVKKFTGLKTWIGTLGQYNHTNRRQTWSEFKEMTEDLGEPISAGNGWRWRWKW